MRELLIEFLVLVLSGFVVELFAPPLIAWVKRHTNRRHDAAKKSRSPKKRSH